MDEDAIDAASEGSEYKASEGSDLEHSGSEPDADLQKAFAEFMKMRKGAAKPKKVIKDAKEKKQKKTSAERKVSPSFLSH